jgi:hypothetical protein
MASSLVKRLRIQPGQRVLILNAPEGHSQSLDDLPEGVEVSETRDGKYDFVHVFVSSSTEYADLGPTAGDAVAYDRLPWISYPKGSSKVPTDLTRDVQWKLSEDTGLRPIARVSIDAVWSAMRFRPADVMGQ